jgi:hypothetical protein
MSKRVLSATTQSRFEEKLESIGVNEFVEGIAMDRGSYIAVIHEEDTTFIDQLNDKLTEYKELTDELWEVVDSDRDRTVKMTQIAMALEEARDRGMVGNYVGTIELESDASESTAS